MIDNRDLCCDHVLTRNESAMYFRKKTSGGRAYLQIVESRREGAQVRHQVVATLGTTYFNFTLFGCFCCEVFSMCLNYSSNCDPARATRKPLAHCCASTARRHRAGIASFLTTPSQFLSAQMRLVVIL